VCVCESHSVTDRQTGKPVGDVARDAAGFASVVYTAQAVLRTHTAADRHTETLSDNKGRL